MPSSYYGHVSTRKLVSNVSLLPVSSVLGWNENRLIILMTLLTKKHHISIKMRCAKFHWKTLLFSRKELKVGDLKAA